MLCLCHIFHHHLTKIKHPDKKVTWQYNILSINSAFHFPEHQALADVIEAFIFVSLFRPFRRIWISWSWSWLRWYRQCSLPFESLLPTLHYLWCIKVFFPRDCSWSVQHSYALHTLQQQSYWRSSACGFPHKWFPVSLLLVSAGLCVFFFSIRADVE